MILQSVIELGGRFNCSWDGSISGNASSRSVLSNSLLAAVEEFVVGCGEGCFDACFASFFCCFKNTSKRSISIEYNESFQ